MDQIIVAVVITIITMVAEVVINKKAKVKRLHMKLFVRYKKEVRFMNKKDYSNLKKLYDEFIENYVLFNKGLGIDNPIVIYYVYHYLYSNGYLSINNDFKFNDKNSYDKKGLYGASVIKGEGVCRHITAMLCDILNKYGIQSYPLAVYYEDYKVKLKKVEKQEMDIDAILDYIDNLAIDSYKKNDLMDNACLMDEEGFYVKVYKEYKNNLIHKLFGNHVITLALFDDKSYFLDATNLYTYRIDDDNTLHYLDRKLPIKDALVFNLFHDFKDSAKIKEMLKHSQISMKNEEALLDRAFDICLSNDDLFKDFHDSNLKLIRKIGSYK